MVVEEKWYHRSLNTFILFSLMCQEWGDVSQIAAIGMAAHYGLMGIIVGGIIAHILTIVLAIIIGVVVENVLSEKLVNGFSGLLFMTFATIEVYRFLFVQE